MSDFKPSDVILAPIPLVGTMGKAEAEFAATLIVRTCQSEGDRWQPVAPQVMGRVIRDDLKAEREPLHSLNSNPFFRPDFYELVNRGFARWVEQEGKGPIELTTKGIDSLGRWVEPS